MILNNQKIECGNPNCKNEIDLSLSVNKNNRVFLCTKCGMIYEKKKLNRES
jgi:hypothetical protein